MEFNLQEIKEIYENETTISETARTYCKKNNIEYSDSVRRKFSRLINKEGINDLENETETETNQYTTAVSFMPSAWDVELNRFLTIEEFCKKYGLNKETVKSSKLVSHNQSHMTYNIAFYTPEEEAILDVQDSLDEIVKKYIKPVEINKKNRKEVSPEYFDRLVYTDTHIAMDVNGGGDPMYEGKWDKEEVLNRLGIMINHVVSFQKSNMLFIDDLGDFLDGLDGETTRKGHALPQNMNNKEAFDLAIEFKVRLVEELLEYYSEIHCNNVNNDNHSGDMAYFVNSAVKTILEAKYPKIVYVNNIKKFFGHYSCNNHTFVLCHGKDVGNLKFGFKPVLDSKQIEKIDQYCKEHSLYNGNFIEFSKGDSHQGVFDDTTSNDFHYYNYPSFSPPSDWVKTNFKNTKSGFRFYNIDRERNIKITVPYWF